MRTFKKIAEYLPHAAPMILLDQVIAGDAEQVRVAVTIGPNHPFAQSAGVAAHVGLEMMAQACGVYAGLQAHGDPSKMGFLLGTRNYQSLVDWFGFGHKLVVEAKVVFRDEEMGVFDCVIMQQDQVIVTAQLTLYQPKDLEAALAHMKDSP